MGAVRATPGGSLDRDVSGVRPRDAQRAELLAGVGGAERHIEVQAAGGVGAQGPRGAIAHRYRLRGTWLVARWRGDVPDAAPAQGEAVRVRAGPQMASGVAPPSASVSSWTTG